MMFNLKNIPEEIKTRYFAGAIRFENTIKNLNPRYDDLPMTPLQRLRTLVYHIGNRLKELSPFPSELIGKEIVNMHIALDSYSSFIEYYYPIPKGIRKKLYGELIEVANAFVERKGTFFRKYFLKKLNAEIIFQFGQKLVDLNFQMHQWHLKFEKNQGESSLNSNSLWQ